MEFNKYGEVLEHISLKDYNTYKVDSLCKYFISINSIDNLVNFVNDYHDKYFIIGNGSNIILKRENYDYPFIKLEFNEINKLNDNEYYVGAGVMPGALINELYKENLGGLEWASGIPGTIGGIIYNNAGAYNDEISNFVVSVKVLDKDDNQIKEINKEDCGFKYRDSIFKETNRYIILGATLKFKNVDVKEAKELILDRLTRRKASQPLEYPSAGSVFRNPEGDFAGRLVEVNEFKNYHINDAYVSEKHANFIINKGNASGADIVNLINEIKQKVKDNDNVELFLEQEIIE